MADQSTVTKEKTEGFSEAEKEAMRERARELKKGKKDGEADLLEKIAEMPEEDRVIAERIHQIVKSTAPELQPRTWYGTPAYAKDGKPPAFGEVFVNKPMAETLRKIASGGRDAFYQGDIARRIVERLNKLGWPVTMEDLAYQHSDWVEPISTTYKGYRVYELPPGEKTWPYHYEVGCEEWAIVLSGRPTLRSPDGLQQLEPGDLAVFPEGPEGAHLLSNGTDEPCRVLLLSSKSPVAMIHYPDSDKVGLWSQARGYEAMLPRTPTLDYWHGED